MRYIKLNSSKNFTGFTILIKPVKYKVIRLKVKALFYSESVKFILDSDFYMVNLLLISPEQT